MADLTPGDNKFHEEMGSFFYDMMKAAGLTMYPGNFPERVRDIGTRMAKAVERAAERKSIEVIKQLQGAVLKGFEGTEKDLKDLRELVVKQQELIGLLMNKGEK